MSATGSRCSTRGGHSPKARRTRFVRTLTLRMPIAAAAGVMSEHALAVEGLAVHYAGVPAVRGIDLGLGAGEIVGLVGPNGAGKSSTLHAVMGVVGAAAGDVRLRGRSLHGLSPERGARLGGPPVPEGRPVYASVAVTENLPLPLRAPRGP